jgi:hypothetical protein
MPRPGSRLLAITAALAAMSGCASVLGIEELPAGVAAADGGMAGDDGAAGSDSADGPAACGAFALAGACAACTASSCCAAASACRADSVCSLTEDCTAACKAGDEACRAACAKGSSAALDALVACQAKGCASPCQLGCGGMLGLYRPDLVTRSADCASCLAASSCDGARTCSEDASCLAYVACAHACNPLDPACAQRCVALHPGGDVKAAAVDTPCSGPCERGKQWSCLGKVSWPAMSPGLTSIKLGVIVLDGLTSKPLEGIAARACAKIDAACTSPLDTGTTDATGKARLTVPVTSQPAGFFGIIELSGPGLLPVLGFPEPTPVSDMDLPALPTLSITGFAAAAQSLGMVPDSTRGHAELLVRDCQFDVATGVTFDIDSADASSIKAYFSGGLPSKTAVATDSSGIGGIFDIPAGPATITAKLAATGQVIATAQIIVRQGALTVTTLMPMP